MSNLPELFLKNRDQYIIPIYLFILKIAIFVFIVIDMSNPL